MFETHHFLQLLPPRVWADYTLDSARAGDPVHVWNVTRALQITGDLENPYTERKDHEPEYLQAPDAGAGRCG